MSNPQMGTRADAGKELMNMRQIAVCDDNCLHLQHAVAMVEAALPPAQAEVSAFSGGSALLKSMAVGDYTPDIAVLDIRMAEIDGISLARELNRLAPGCQIIFLTSYVDYAPDVYQIKHLWFVPKERAQEFLAPAIERALANNAPSEPASILTVRSQGRVLLLPFQDIVYIDRLGRKTRIVCRTESFLVSQSPGAVITPALALQMIHCHQGYWINMEHITALDHSEFILDTGARIPISRTYRDEARRRFFERWIP